MFGGSNSLNSGHDQEVPQEGSSRSVRPWSSERQPEITRLLERWSDGDEEAGERLFEVVYQELRQIAVGHMLGERTGHTLQPTALVHEAFLRLRATSGVEWRGRKHLYALVSRIIRRILIDHARRTNARKRGGDFHRVPFSEAGVLSVQEPDDLLELDAALERLKELDPLQATVVELKFFGGMTLDEIAEATERSPATVGRLYRVARLWLYRELSRDGG